MLRTGQAQDTLSNLFFSKRKHFMRKFYSIFLPYFSSQGSSCIPCTTSYGTSRVYLKKLLISETQATRL